MNWLIRTNPTVVYTDGSCTQKRGGWAAVILDGSHTIELSGFEANTTANRMEMLAVIKALETLPSKAYVFLFTDSQYVQKGIMLWVRGWKKREWVTTNNQAVKNADLWKQMDIQAERLRVSWHWVKGHNGNEYNERCDSLAKTAASNCN